jgi:formate hydrogenlyase subunit 4
VITFLLGLVHFAALLALPILQVGVVNRTKSLWGGRKGPQLHQLWFDLVRLARKEPVYSETTSWVVKAGPVVVLATTLTAGLLAPLVAGWAPVSFPLDFVVFAYVMGLGRVFMMLAALDTGSAFEGMGASREATYGALTEPAFFVLLGTLGLATGESSFSQLVAPSSGHVGFLAVLLGAVTLIVLLQVEAARVPVDDPNTHLELTMIHEVMILDHSGPDLAALQYAAAVKLTVCSALVAALLNPFTAATQPLLAALASIGLTLAVAVVVGLFESLMARFRMSALPRYTLVALVAALLSLALTVFVHGRAA